MKIQSVGRCDTPGLKRVRIPPAGGQAALGEGGELVYSSPCPFHGNPRLPRAQGSSLLAPLAWLIWHELLNTFTQRSTTERAALCLCFKRRGLSSKDWTQVGWFQAIEKTPLVGKCWFHLWIWFCYYSLARPYTGCWRGQKKDVCFREKYALLNGVE